MQQHSPKRLLGQLPAKLLASSAVVILAICALVYVQSLGLTANSQTDDGAMRLQAPSFLDAAYAQNDGTQSIADEAGISAYFKAPSTIDLAQMRDLFRFIETDNDEYLVGAMAVPGYEDIYEVRIYIHTDGWVMAYYLNTSPLGTIFDWKAYSGTSLNTILELSLDSVAAKIGIGNKYEIQFYDFRHPQATHLLLVAEHRAGEGIGSFNIKLPDNYTYYDRSLGLGKVGGAATFELNGTQLIEIPRSQPWVLWWGSLSSSQLGTGSFHNIKITCDICYDSSDAVMGGLAIIYKE